MHANKRNWRKKILRLHKNYKKAQDTKKPKETPVKSAPTCKIKKKQNGRKRKAILQDRNKLQHTRQETYEKKKNSQKTTSAACQKTKVKMRKN